jgi:hypothetical protein
LTGKNELIDSQFWKALKPTHQRLWRGGLRILRPQKS